MTKKAAPRIKNFWKSFRPGRKSLAAFFLIMFIFGYQTFSFGLSISVIETQCKYGCFLPPPLPQVCECAFPGTTSNLAQSVITEFAAEMAASAAAVELAVNRLTDNMVSTLLQGINNVELDMIDWWENMWETGLLPAMQAMTAQLNVATADQSRVMQSMTDSGNLTETRLVRQDSEIQDHRTFRASETTCTEATVSGGTGRSSTFARAMRGGWERENLDAGINTASSAGASSAASTLNLRFDAYKNIFCDPGGNGGNNNCNSTNPAYYNADTQPSKFIYNRLTTDVTDPNLAAAVEAINNNLAGVVAMDPIPLGALQSAPGQETFLGRRAYLARHAAIRSVPQLISGWRMPGSQMGKWIKSLRQDAGVPDSRISDNPSYREIIHAATVDRFNSGKYAISMTADNNEVEREKLTLDVFYLMQLRDYYELLERTALTLAVQVSIMTDQQPLPDINSQRLQK